MATSALCGDARERQDLPEQGRQPAPFPETLIEAASDLYVERAMGSRHAGLSAFAPDALDAYKRALRQPGAVHGMCEDYRASAGIDLEHDRADLESGRRIGQAAYLAAGGQPDAAGAALAPQLAFLRHAKGDWSSRSSCRGLASGASRWPTSEPRLEDVAASKTTFSQTKLPSDANQRRRSVTQISLYFEDQNVKDVR